MDLPTPVNFRTSQPNAASIVGAAPQKSGNSQDQARFEQHLNDTSSQNNQPSAADRRQAAINADRRNNSSSNDQTDTSTDTQSASNDTTTQAVSSEATSDQTDSSSASNDTTPSDAQKKAADNKANDTAAKDTTNTADAGATTQTTTKTDETKAAPTTDTVAEAAKKAASATKTDDQKQSKTTDKKPTDLAALATAPVQVPNDQQKPETKTTDTPSTNTNAPIAPSETPLAAATANATPKDATSDAQPEDANPDAKLTITAKDGLGHEAAAKMADKTDAKANAAQQATAHTNAQSPNATATATSTTTQNFAKMVAAASGGDSSSVSATSSATSNGTALSDLQSVGNTTQSQSTPSVTVRVGTLPGQSTPTQIPAMTIALQVARNLQKGINRFDIRLDPAEMGKIDVRMEVKKDGNVAAHLMVERPETLQLLRRDASALQQALNDAGLQANADSLSFSLQDNNAGNQTQNFAGQSASGSGLSNLEPAKDEVSLSPIYNVNLSASGGVDIRI